MKNKVGNICLSVLSILLTILALEIGARTYKGEFSFHNFLELHRDLFRSAYPAIFDKELGWIPKKGFHKKNVWNTRVTILDDGIRSNGNNKSKAGDEIILAVGDSFTFGDEVSDEETWPARLEAKSNNKVINGGVFGYGIDQSYLRMLDLAAKYQPTIIIFSFHPDDIYRCELSKRTSAPKPYFEIGGNGNLALMKKHVVPPASSENPLNIFKRALGYSFLIHKLASRGFREYWIEDRWKTTRVHSKGLAITCRVFEELKDYSQKNKVKLYILAQYDKWWLDDNHGNDIGIVDKVKSCIDQDVLKLIDLRTPLVELREYDPARFNNLFYGHMSKKGNEFVASILWESITK